MKEFMDDSFLLKSDLAQRLYNDIKSLPIIDYHCHLDPREIAENKRFSSITEMWLGGDHYKWRLMRANGVPEEYITGDAGDWEKFEKWAETIEDCIGSPLYHWTHLELKRYFGYDGLLSKKTAKDIWEHTDNIIAGADFSVWSILTRFNVESLCTTDDPVDSLEYHRQLRDSALKTVVLPAFRPSKAFAIEAGEYAQYISRLQDVSGIAVTDYDSLLAALYDRMEYFHQNGCRLSDHAFDPPVFEPYLRDELGPIVKRALSGQSLTKTETDKYKTALIADLGTKYNALGWVMQLHMNALRSNNTLMLKKLGPDTGYDSVLDAPIAVPLARILDSLAVREALPKTILYSLNSSDDDAIATMAGNFQGGAKGKIQYGAAWWFNDTKRGMEKQMVTLASQGLLARFIGMLTDSRSHLSYTRHEYFRRITANLLAQWVLDGEFPNDYDKLREIAQGIAYYNAKEYFA